MQLPKDFPLQPQKILDGIYTATIEDNGVVFNATARASLIIDNALPPGFYCTVVNAREATTTIQTTNGQEVVSASGAVSLTAAYQSVTVLKLLNGDVIAMGVP